MNRIFIGLALFNSVGTFMVWLVMTPYYGQIANGVASLGVLGLLRQVTKISGSLIAGVYGDTGRPFRRHFLTELSIFIAACFLLVILHLSSGLAIYLIPTWVAIRFFFGGMSFVFGYKFIASSMRSLGDSSILHLMILQGATIFGPPIAMVMPLITDTPFIVSIYFQLFFSALYLIYLYRKLNTDLDIDFGELQEKSFIKNVKDAITLFWHKSLYPWNYLQFFMLIAIEGYVIQNYTISIEQPWIQAKIFFPAVSMVYGVIMLVTGIMVKRTLRPKLFALMGSGILFISGFPLVFMTEINHLLFQFFLYILGFWFVLHSTNTLMLHKASPNISARLRSSQIFYLSVLIGIGEYFYGEVFHYFDGFKVIGLTRSFFIFFGVVIVLISMKASSTKRLHAR